MSQSGDIAAYGCDVIGIVAHDETQREAVAKHCAGVVVDAMQLFENNALAQMAAARAIYNMCYRSEPGHRAVNQADPEPALYKVLDRFGADVELVQVANTLKDI